jgi:2-polyprenyl-3-methyl-5-hydroxy-6-metoxy-1,4-benzoquinol methylase
MPTPWLTLSLADYEGHMSAPNVGQADLLAGVFADALAEFRPASVAVIGCAGGNGFDRMNPLEVARVVGVDINRDFLAVAAQRYRSRFEDLQLLCTDISVARLQTGPVDLIYAALLFEYVDVPAALQNLFLACRDGGHLVTLLQLPSKGAAAVTPTAFTSLATLREVLKLVEPLDLRARAQESGFTFLRAANVTSAAGKEFAVQIFQRPSPNNSASFSGA